MIDMDKSARSIVTPKAPILTPFITPRLEELVLFNPIGSLNVVLDNLPLSQLKLYSPRQGFSLLYANVLINVCLRDHVNLWYLMDAARLYAWEDIFRLRDDSGSLLLK
jgi:hypothetical protein